MLVHWKSLCSGFQIEVPLIIVTLVSALELLLWWQYLELLQLSGWQWIFMRVWVILRSHHQHQENPVGINMMTPKSQRWCVTFGINSAIMVSDFAIFKLTRFIHSCAHHHFKIWSRYLELVALYYDDLLQDCSISIANALEILQSCTEPLIRSTSRYEHCGLTSLNLLRPRDEYIDGLSQKRHNPMWLSYVAVVLDIFI